MMEPAAFMDLAANLNERDEIDGAPNLKSLLLEAEAAGFIRPHPSGKLNMRPPQHEGSINILGKDIPIEGELWTIWVLTDSGRTALLPPNDPGHDMR